MSVPSTDFTARWEISPLFASPGAPGRAERLEALSAVFEDPGGFLGAEAAGAPLAGHRLLGSDLQAVLRHGTKDLGVADEVFGQGYYEPPEEVAATVEDLPAGARVVDLGANVGLAALWFAGALDRPRLECYEPDPRNREVLERCAAVNAAAADWTVVGACAGAQDGEAWFLPRGFSSSRQATDCERDGATRVPAVDVVAGLPGAHVLKMDIEGGEWAIVEDERFAEAGVPVLVLEYHPHLCPGAEPRARMEARLQDAGYRVHHLFERADEQVGMLWAWLE